MDHALGIRGLISGLAAMATCSVTAGGADQEPPEVTVPAAIKAWCFTPSHELLAMIYDAGGRLRPVIPIRAVAELSACTARSPGFEAHTAVAAIKEAEYKPKRVPGADIREEDTVNGMFDECAVSSEVCEVDVYMPADGKLKEYRKAKTGGLSLAFMLGHAGDAGHYEATRAAMVSAQGKLEVMWPPALLDLVSDASGDADFYDWGTPAAHAQARNNEDNGEIIEQSDEAKKNFNAWVAGYAKLAMDKCKAGQASDAAYYIGYMLHAVQDLAFHEGITNAEHSYLDNVEEEAVDSNDGKLYEQKMYVAVAGSTRVIIGFANAVRISAPACWTAMTNGPVEAPSFFRKVQLLNKGPDFSLWEAVKFSQLGYKVRDGMKIKGQQAFILQSKWLNGVQEAKMIEAIDAMVATNFPE